MLQTTVELTLALNRLMDFCCFWTETDLLFLVVMLS